MIVVIQCAARKQPDAGHLRDKDGRPVFFIANPKKVATADPNIIHVRPDDISDQEITWREHLVTYNKHPGDNPLKLLPAWRLYRHPVYAKLVDRFGVSNVYILSAGWGLIAADFLTSAYDITFTNRADDYKRRRRQDCYADLCMLPADTTQPVVFFGAKDYLPLFCQLTENIETRKTVFYRSARPPTAPGCSLKRFNTRTRTNWHYECAQAYMEESISN